MLYKLFCLLSGIFFISFSALGNVAPKTCPDVDLIKSEGFDKIKLDRQLNQYYAVKKSHYHTDFQWSFSFGFFEGLPRNVILRMGEQYLSMINGNPSPVNYENRSWTCTYEVDNNFWAMAVFSAGA